jgi:hypothetical protein
LVEIKKISKYILDNLVTAKNVEEQQNILKERAKLNVEIQTFRDSFNLEAYEINGGWEIQNVYTILDTTQRNSILEETANTYAEEPTPVKQKLLDELRDQNDLIEEQMKNVDEEDKLDLQQKLESNKIIMNTLTYLIGVNTPEEVEVNTTEPFSRIENSVLNTSIIQTPSHEEVKRKKYEENIEILTPLSDKVRVQTLKEAVADNEYLQTHSDERTVEGLSRKEYNDIAIEVLENVFHTAIQDSPPSDEKKQNLSDEEYNMQEREDDEYNFTSEEEINYLKHMVKEQYTAADYTKVLDDSLDLRILNDK